MGTEVLRMINTFSNTLTMLLLLALIITIIYAVREMRKRERAMLKQLAQGFAEALADVDKNERP